MIVVADSGPLRYLVLIGAIHALPGLYERVLIPQTVAIELQDAKTPAAVSAWIAQPPSWLETHRRRRRARSPADRPPES